MERLSKRSNNQYKSRIEENIWIIVIIIASVAAIYSCSRFKASEAVVVNGDRIILDDGWLLNSSNGITLPHAVAPGNDKDTILSTTIKEGYTGFMLEVPVNNATVTVKVNDNVIYDEKTERTGAYNENLIYLPEYGNRGKLEIILSPIDVSSSIYIRDISVTRGDTAIINQIKGSLLRLLCCVLTFLCGGLAGILEIVRNKSGWKESNLHRLAVFSLLVFVKGLAGSRLPSMFWGNEPIFNVIGGLSLSLMPVAIVMYYHSDGKEFSKEGQILLSVVSVLCISSLFILLFTDIGISGYICYAAILLTSFDFLFHTIKEKGSFAEMIWQILLALYAISGIMSEPGKAPDYLSPIIITLSLVMCIIRQIMRFIADYRAIVEKSEQEAIRANEAKGAFLANMSHEIRTPINAVLGMDEMILRESTEQEVRNYAMDIRSAGQTLLSIINDILDLSKIESGKMEIIPTDYDSVSMIRDAINLITPKAEEKNLKFITKVDSSLPVTLHGDDIRIRQIMTNLLSNAVKYTEKGKIGLFVKWEKISDDKGKLICEVKDTGIGIKKKDIPKLFDKYTRFDEALHKHTEGTGLGMSITMQMLTLMDGELCITSNYGKGSSFKASIVQNVIDGTGIGNFNEKAKIHTDDFVYSYTLYAAKANVLIVDDNAMNRKVFMSLLKDSQIKIKEAGSGKECLDCIKKEHFDLIFLDHMMPGMDGLETFKKMRQMDTKCNGVPVIILTANALVGDREKYLAMGFDGYLAKPVITDELNKQIMANMPKGMVKTKKIKGAVKEESTTVDIDGIDANYLKLHFKDKKMQTMALKEFFKGAKIQMNKLSLLYRDIDKKEIVDEYRICVHAMKSSAATIGEIELFGLAKTLEYAARDYNEDIIDALHLIFIDKWKVFTKTLGFVLGYKEKSKKKPLDKQVMEALLLNLSSAMEIMDVDTADLAIKQLSSYDFGKAEKYLEQLKIAVNDLDPDKAEETINNIKEVLR